MKDARQYTVPVEDALRRVRNGENPELTTREKHTRECYVVAEEGADKALIEKQIKEMPNYFADYDTTVTFISEEEMKRDHAELPHGGQVIRTASVLAACARAITRMHSRGVNGCKTIFDIAPADLSPMDPAEIRKKLL